MISTAAKGRDRWGYYGHGRNYDQLASNYVKEREAKISKDKAKDMSKDDKELIKGLKPPDDADDGDKKDEDKKDDNDLGSAPPIPELTPPKPKALSQKKKHKKKRSSLG